ncbi:transmembrane protein 200A [Gadus morhua]|uniref:Transmembrane protein 200A n=1 Tax=Gadus morhua TaxID=8049 RepID=A0A8C5BXD5_GADMO|nr:transmembrane protein 200A [Gadus morhua]XP_030201932.1 transmembrane protein 200A [Gadus morhua]
MTAAAGVLTGLAKLKRQDSSRSQHRSLQALNSCPGNPTPEPAPRKRKRRSDIVVVRGRLRLYSASGFFLLLGLVILAMGIGMATLGYWPHGANTQAFKSKPAEAGGGTSKSSPGDQQQREAGDKMAAAGAVSGGKMAVVLDGQTSGPAGGLLTRFLDQHRHSERMKMFGPFTMGIGIFIFICANAILHENRDRETKVIHMRDMYSTVIDIHRLRQREIKHQRHNGSFSAEHGGPELRSQGPDASGAARLASHALLAFSSRAGMGSLGGVGGGGGGGAGSAEEEEVLLGGGEEHARVDFGLGGLLAPFYKDRPAGRADPSRRQRSVDREAAEGGGGHRARSIVSSSLSAFTLPVIKLNNCVIDQPDMEAITEEERGAGGAGGEKQSECLRPLASMESLVVPEATLAKASKLPGLHRSNSASMTSQGSFSSSSSLSPAPSSTSGCWLSPGAARSDFGSNNSLHMLSSHSKSLDLERGQSMLSVRPEQRKHPSWPRLDRSNSGRGAGAGASVSRSGSTKGYARLEDREEPTGSDRLLDADANANANAAAAARRDYSKREKLLMISRSHNNLSFERDDANSSALKRGSSETRF